MASVALPAAFPTSGHVSGSADQVRGSEAGSTAGLGGSSEGEGLTEHVQKLHMPLHGVLASVPLSSPLAMGSAGLSEARGTRLKRRVHSRETARRGPSGLGGGRLREARPPWCPAPQTIPHPNCQVADPSQKPPPAWGPTPLVHADMQNFHALSPVPHWTHDKGSNGKLEPGLQIPSHHRPPATRPSQTDLEESARVRTPTHRQIAIIVITIVITVLLVICPLSPRV